MKIQEERCNGKKRKHCKGGKNHMYLNFWFSLFVVKQFSYNQLCLPPNLQKTHYTRVFLCSFEDTIGMLI